MEDEFDYDLYELPEDNTSLVECTCEHEPDEHGWAGCSLCDCEGRWEE